MTIDFEWMPHGEVLADADTIRFEPAPRIPGLYRIDLDEAHTYIGETLNLARRFYGYRKPGGSERAPMGGPAVMRLGVG